MHNFKFFAVLGLFLTFPFILFSQSNGLLFNEIESGTETILAKTKSGETQERLYYRLNNSIFEDGNLRKGESIRVETDVNTFTEMQITRVTEYIPGTLSVIAKDVSNNNQKFSFTYSNGRVNGLFHQHDHSTIFFEHDVQTDENYISSTSPYRDDELSCGVTHEHANIALPDPGQFNKSKSFESQYYNPPHIRALTGESMYDEVTIDLMIVYTDKAEQWANSSQHGSIEEVIAQAMNLSQLGLDNSDQGINLRLVHVHKTDYDEDGENCEDDGCGEIHLRRLSKKGTTSSPFDTDLANVTGFMEEVHDLRDQYGADLVAMFADMSDTGGIAWLNNSTAGNPSIGFSVNRVQQTARTFTLIHEIGHKMGSAHSRTQEEAAAGSLGGLFKYSTGFQVGSGDSQLNTIMAYNESGASGNNLPFFSSPQLTTSGGIPAGSERSDNVLGFNQVKRAIAAYRSTTVDPPSISVSPSNVVEVNLTDEETLLSVPFTISNSGDSELSWSIDFDMTSTTFDFLKKKQSPESDETIQPAEIPNQEIPMANQLPRQFGKTTDGAKIIYQTGFEAEEGFSHTGIIDTLGGWRVLRSGMNFSSTTQNPASGNRHLRINSTSTSDETIIVRPPFFGLQPVGDFEFSADIAINRGSETEDELFDIYLWDASLDEISAGIIISDGRLFTYGKNSNGQENFFRADYKVPANNQYFNLRIAYDASMSMLNYYVDDELIRSLRYTRPNTPDFAWFLNRNETSDAYFDIDNVKLERKAEPFTWLDVDRYSGVSPVSGSQDLILSFTAAGSFNGTYSTELIINSNDPDQPVVRVPINVTVNLDDPINGPGIPDEVTLDQNFPNPFNPTTRIRYALDRPQQVNLEVFNITGQKIATLVNQQQPPGTYQVNFDASNLSSGIYIYRLQTPSRVLTRKMILVK